MAIRLQMKPLIGHFKLQQLTKAIYQKHYINELEKNINPVQSDYFTIYLNLLSMLR